MKYLEVYVHNLQNDLNELFLSKTKSTNFSTPMGNFLEKVGNTEKKNVPIFQDYRPVASAAAGSAFAALIDMKDSDESDFEKERQRKLLLQIQRTKWLASHGKISGSSSIASGFSSEKSSSKSAGGLDLSKYGSVRMKELQEAHISGYEAQNEEYVISVVPTL